MSLIAPIPENEQQRLEWLRQCDILDTLPEAAFDEATQLAAQLCQVPIAAINLVDDHRQWSKSSVGQDKSEGSRDISFCAHTILQPDLIVVPDARDDTRFADNPLVTGDPHIRFYAGAPLITTEGFGIGSLCVVDCVPRQLTPEQASVLRLLAHQIVGRIEFLRHVALQNELINDRERLLREVQQVAERQRLFLRVVLSSVTGGKLHLCQKPGDLPSVLGDPSKWIPFSEHSETWELRRRTEEATIAQRFAPSRRSDLITAVSEAAMNAVVHGGGGAWTHLPHGRHSPGVGRG